MLRCLRAALKCRSQICCILLCHRSELLETISAGFTGFRYVGPQFPTLQFWDMAAFECLCWGALRATAMHRMLRRAKWMFACAWSTSYYPDTFRVFDGVYISHDIVWPLEHLYYIISHTLFHRKNACRCLQHVHVLGSPETIQSVPICLSPRRWPRWLRGFFPLRW